MFCLPLLTLLFFRACQLPSEADVSAAARARALALGPELAQQPYQRRDGLGGQHWITPSAAAAMSDTLLSDDPAPVTFRNGSSRPTPEVDKAPENVPRKGADRRAQMTPAGKRGLICSGEQFDYLRTYLSALRPTK